LEELRKEGSSAAEQAWMTSEEDQYQRILNPRGVGRDDPCGRGGVFKGAKPVNKESERIVQEPLGGGLANTLEYFAWPQPPEKGGESFSSSIWGEEEIGSEE